MSARSLCPDCGSSDGLAQYSDNTYCYSCRKYTTNKKLASVESKIINPGDFDINPYIPKKGLDWLSKYLINDYFIRKFRLGWSNKLNRLVVPYYINGTYIYAWLRDVDGNSNSKWLYAGSINNKKIPFLIHEQVFSYDRVLLVEDAISAIRCSSFIPTISLGGLNFNQSNFTQKLLGYKKILVWFDGDSAGRIASTEFRKKFKVFRDIQLIRTKSDPKEHLNSQIGELLQ